MLPQLLLVAVFIIAIEIKLRHTYLHTVRRVTDRYKGKKEKSTFVYQKKSLLAFLLFSKIKARTLYISSSTQIW